MKVNIKQILFLLIILSLYSFPLTAGNIKVDSSKVEVRTFEKELVQKYLDKRNYNYEKNPKYEKNSLRRWWYLFLQKIQKAIGRENLESTWDILKVVIILLGLGILFQFLYRSNKTSVFKRSDKSPDYHPRLIKSEDAEENLQQLISQSESAKDYTSAIRYNFLNVLRILNDRQLIDWKEYKTNEEYVSEIRDVDVSDQFERVSRIFEFINYGEFGLDQEDYENYKAIFEEMTEMTKAVENG